MEKCQKCSGIMLPMRTRKSALPDHEKKQGWKCSRCGFYLEKQQTFTSTGHFGQDNGAPYYLRRRQT